MGSKAPTKIGETALVPVFSAAFQRKKPSRPKRVEGVTARTKSVLRNCYNYDCPR